MYLDPVRQERACARTGAAEWSALGRCLWEYASGSVAHDHIIRLYILEVSAGCAATVSQTRRSGYMHRGSLQWRNSNRLTAAQPPVSQLRGEAMMPRVLCAGIAAQAQEKTTVVLVKARRAARTPGADQMSRKEQAELTCIPLCIALKLWRR